MKSHHISIIILVIGFLIGFLSAAQCQAQNPGPNDFPPPGGDFPPPNGDMKGPPPFMKNDELLKKAFEKKDPAIQDFIKKQIKDKGPEGLQDEAFRKELQKKLDGQSDKKDVVLDKKADQKTSKDNQSSKNADDKKKVTTTSVVQDGTNKDCPDCLAKQSQVIEKQISEMKELRDQLAAAQAKIDAKSNDMKIKMQKKLVEDQIEEINNKIADLNDQIDEYKYKECAMPSGDFPRPDMGSDEIDGDKKPPMGKDFDPSKDDKRPPMNKDFDPSKFAGGKSPDMSTLMLDLPSDLESDIRNAKNDLSSTRTKLSSAKRTWRRNCQKEARSRPNMQERSGGNLASMGMPQQMNGAGNSMMNGMNPNASMGSSGYGSMMGGSGMMGAGSMYGSGSGSMGMGSMFGNNYSSMGSGMMGMGSMSGGSGYGSMMGRGSSMFGGGYGSSMMGMGSMGSGYGSMMGMGSSMQGYGSMYGSTGTSNPYSMFGSSYSYPSYGGYSSSYGGYSSPYSLMGSSASMYSPYSYGGYSQGGGASMPMVYKP